MDYFTLNNGVRMPVVGFGTWDVRGKAGKTAGQVALRYLTQNGIAVIPKSVHRDRMEQNLHSLDFTLSQEDMGQLAGLNEGRSLFGWY